jgi:hypothetical protein
VRFTVFAFLIAFLVVLAVPVSALSGWNYYRPITITNGLSQTLTDYQVNFTLDTANLIAQGKMRSDCGDLRVTQSDGQTLLPYWIDPATCNTNNTRIWIKVPSISASSSVTIYVWYGNPSATSVADGVATFDLFDDFLGTSLNTTIWATNISSGGSITVSNGWLKLDAAEIVSYPYFSCVNCTVMAKANATAGYEITVRLSSGAPNVISIPGYGGLGTTFSGYQHAIAKDNTVLSNVANAISGNTIYIFQLIRYGSNIYFIRYDANYNLQVSVSASNTAYTTLYPGLRVDGTGNGNRVAYFDWIAVRKYVSPEPSIAIGSELIAKPDLTVTSADYSPKPAYVQQQVNISAQIANIGNWTSPIANVTLYINGNAIQTAQISGLNPNETTTVTLAWTPDAIGNYTATVVVDPENAINEVNENNNGYNLTIEVSKIAIADLIVSVILPQSSLVNKEVAFSVVVMNIGSATAYNFSIVVYLDANKLDERKIASLDPDGQILLGYSFTPHEARTYTVTVIADPENSVIESAENNNIVNATIKVVAFGDVVKIPTPPKPEGRTLKEVYENMTLRTFGLPLEMISLIALLGIAVIGYGFGAFKGTVNLFFLSVLYYVAANALGWSIYIATGLLVVSAILLVIVVAFLKED